MSVTPIQKVPVQSQTAPIQVSEAEMRLLELLTPIRNIKLTKEQKIKYKLTTPPPSAKAQEVFNREMQRLKERRAIEGGTFS